MFVPTVRKTNTFAFSNTSTDCTQSLGPEQHSPGHWSYSRSQRQPAACRTRAGAGAALAPHQLPVSHQWKWNLPSRKWIFTEVNGANCISLPGARECHAAVQVAGFAMLVNTMHLYWYTSLTSASDHTPCILMFASPILSQFKMLAIKSKISN